MSVTYAAFPESEHRECLARARKILRQNDIDCCVSVAPEHLYYLAGYDSWVSVNSPQALIFMPQALIFMADGGEPSTIGRGGQAGIGLYRATVEPLVDSFRRSQSRRKRARFEGQQIEGRLAPRLMRDAQRIRLRRKRRLVREQYAARRQRAGHPEQRPVR